MCLVGGYQSTSACGLYVNIHVRTYQAEKLYIQKIVIKKIIIDFFLWQPQFSIDSLYTPFVSSPKYYAPFC